MQLDSLLHDGAAEKREHRPLKTKDTLSRLLLLFLNTASLISIFAIFVMHFIIPILGLTNISELTNMVHGTL